MCGVRDYGHIDHRLARLANLVMDVAPFVSLRSVSNVIRKKGKGKKNDVSAWLQPDLYESWSRRNEFSYSETS